MFCEYSYEVYAIHLIGQNLPQVQLYWNLSLYVDKFVSSHFLGNDFYSFDAIMRNNYKNVHVRTLYENSK